MLAAVVNARRVWRVADRTKMPPPSPQSQPLPRSSEPPAGALPSAPLPPDTMAIVQAVLDGLPGQVCLLDAQGTIVAVNRAWEQFGAARGGQPSRLSVGVNYLATCERAAEAREGLGGQAEARLVAQGLRDVLAGRRDAFQLDYECATPHQVLWFIARISRMPIPALGQAPQVVVAHDDITFYRQAQIALQQREQLLADLAASIPGAMFSLVQPQRGPWRFVYLSPGFERLTELDPEAVCADRRLFDRLVETQDRPAVKAGIGTALAEGRVWSHVYRVRTARTGQVRWLHALAQPGRPPVDGEPRPWTGLISDVTETHAVEQALREREETYRTLFETVAQGVVYQDTEGRITAANPAAQRILGMRFEQLRGRSSLDPQWQAVREDGSPLPGNEHPALVALRIGRPVTDVVMGLEVAGRGRVWILVGAVPVLRDGVVQHVHTSFEDITEQVRLREELRLQASTDALTGVANRRSLMNRLSEEFAHARRHPERHFAVLAVDIDHFKLVNDNWGHAAGDAALVHVARLMQRQTRPSDLLGRSGGEEFMVLLRDTDAVAAEALAERLRTAIARSVLRHAGGRLRLTVSIGVAERRSCDSNLDAVLARADRALYAAKHAGRNQVRLGQD